MDVKPQLQEVLNKYSQLNPLPIETLEPSAARQLPELKDAICGVIQDHATLRLMSGYIEPVHSIEHVLIPSGSERILARMYKPFGEGPHPVLLYFHGGGFVLSNLNTYDASCRALTNAADCMVISVAYRQGPEYPYPVARDDAFSAYKWLLKNISNLGGDTHRIAVGGESSGANLATVVCMMAKQDGLKMPIHQFLIYPVTDCDMNTESYNAYADAKPLNREMMKWYFRHYFGDLKSDPLAFPLQSKNLAGMPPATVITAEIDPLASEGEAYAHKLKDFGVPVYFKCFAGMTHEFFGMKSVLTDSREALREVAENLQNAFDDSMITYDLSATLRPEELQSRYMSESTYF